MQTFDMLFEVMLQRVEGGSAKAPSERGVGIGWNNIKDIGV